MNPLTIVGYGMNPIGYIMYLLLKRIHTKFRLIILFFQFFSLYPFFSIPQVFRNFCLTVYHVILLCINSLITISVSQTCFLSHKKSDNSSDYLSPIVWEVLEKYFPLIPSEKIFPRRKAQK